MHVRLRDALCVEGELLRQRHAPLIDRMCALAGVSRAQLFSRHRAPAIIAPRFALAWLLHSRGRTVAEVARILCRDHSSVLHMIHRAEADPNLRALADLAGMDGLQGAALAPLAPLDRTLRAAVMAYLVAMSEGRRFTPQALSGLRALAEQPATRRRARATLALAGLDAHAPRVAQHARTAGYYWATDETPAAPRVMQST